MMNFYSLDIILGAYIKGTLILELVFLDKMRMFTLKKKYLVEDRHVASIYLLGCI